MAASSTRREIGDYIIDKDDDNCIAETYKVRVYLGKHKDNDKKTVAGKMFLWDKRFPTTEVDNEIEFMKSIPPHENVLKLLDHGTTETRRNKELWLILEHCNLGHLGEFVHTRPLNLAQKLDLMLQAAKGVHHLHHMHKPLIHRDIKPANLLVAGKPGQPVVKVADYGESRFFEGSREQSVRNITVGGTPNYQAPELFSDNKTYRPKQNKAVDIFALGMSFQYVLEAEMEQFDQTALTVGKEEIALGRHLYDNPNTDVVRLLMKPGDSADVRDIKLLIAEMLVRDVSKRLTIDKVLLRLRALRTRLWTPVFYFDDLMESEQLLAVNVDSCGGRGVWVHEGSEWERVSDVSSECAYGSVCVCRVHEGVVVCGGKRGGQASRHCHHFSRLTRQWKKLSAMITPRYDASAVEYAAQKVLVAGGRTSDDEDSAVCEVLNNKEGTWIPASDLPEALLKPLMAAQGGKVYILRQYNIRKQPKLLIYEPSSKVLKSTRPSIKFTSALPDNVRYIEGACLAAAGQRLYLLGGGKGLALAYTPLTDQWERLTRPSLRHGDISGCCAAVSAERITVFGGISTEGGKRDGAEVYDIRAGKWHTLDMRLPFGYNQRYDLVAQYDD